MTRTEFASGQRKYAYLDHDTDVVNEVPPVQNTWYEVFNAEDVRLLWCIIIQTNDEAVAKTIGVRWTIDGNVYFQSQAANHATGYYVFRNYPPSAGGTSGLFIQTGLALAALYTDKRGQSFKVEVRMTSAPGTNQVLWCECVRETLEVT